jgi:hypothetical protein
MIETANIAIAIHALITISVALFNKVTVIGLSTKP